MRLSAVSFSQNSSGLCSSLRGSKPRKAASKPSHLFSMTLQTKPAEKTRLAISASPRSSFSFASFLLSRGGGSSFFRAAAPPLRFSARARMVLNDVGMRSPFWSVCGFAESVSAARQGLAGFDADGTVKAVRAGKQPCGAGLQVILTMLVTARRHEPIAGVTGFDRQQEFSARFQHAMDQPEQLFGRTDVDQRDRKSTRLNSSH